MRTPSRLVDLLPDRRISEIGLGQRISDCMFDRFQLDGYPSDVAHGCRLAITHPTAYSRLSRRNDGQPNVVNPDGPAEFPPQTSQSEQTRFDLPNSEGLVQELRLRERQIWS